MCFYVRFVLQNVDAVRHTGVLSAGSHSE